MNVAAPQPASPPRGGRLLILQALRAVAAGMVAWFHLFHFGNPPAVSEGGWVHLQAGVDVFFILSGFVVTQSALAANSARDFLLRRALRIYPLYWLCTLALVPAEIWRKGSAPEATHLLGSLLLWPQEKWPLLGVGWSLVHEVFFYAVLTLFVACGRRRPALWLGIWGSVTLGVAVLGLLHSEPPLPPPLRLALHPLNLEFIAGAVLALIHRRGATSPLPPIPAASCALLLAVAVVAFLPELPMNGLARPLAYGLPAWLLLHACVEGERHHGWRAPRLLPRLGDASYAFYLIHAPLLAGSAMLLPHIAPDQPLFPALAVALILVQALGLAVWRWLELPMLRRLHAICLPATRSRSPSPAANCG